MNIRETSKIFVSSTLVLAFGLFNVGLPVALYLCPMMSSPQPACPMASDRASHELALENQNSSCCGKVIFVERNTTPFVKSHQVDQEKIAVGALLKEHPTENFSAVLHSTTVESPHLHPLPLFLLNSTLLI